MDYQQDYEDHNDQNLNKQLNNENQSIGLDQTNEIQDMGHANTNMNFDGNYNLDDNSNSQQTPSSKQNDNLQNTNQQPKEFGMLGFLSVEFYQQYFNVETEDVFTRCKLAVNPMTSNDFFNKIRENPDLWGPFWVYTSLVFIMASVGNIQGYFTVEKPSFRFDYSFVPLAALLIYLIGFGTPILMSFIMKCFGTQVTAFELVCLYGYSMVIYIPLIILCVIPFNWLQWLFLAVGTANSCFFMIKNLKTEFASYEQNKQYMMYGIIVGVQVLFLLFLKMYFFANFDKYD